MLKRVVTVLGWIVVFVGYHELSGAPQQQQRVGSHSDLQLSLPTVEEQLLARLTRNAWREQCRSYNGWPESCNTVELRADGTYTWVTRSDVGERGDEGRWSFQPNEDGALLFLSESGVVHVRFEGDQLIFGPLDRLHAGEPLPTRSRPSLPAVAPPELFRELTNGPWFKANDFHAYYLPDQAEFRPDGTVVLSYRGGECRLVANWSLYRTGRPRSFGWELIYRGANSCDLRKPHQASSRFKSRVELTEGFLWMSEPYTRNPSATRQQRIHLDDGRLLLEGTFSGPLVAGHSVKGDLTLEPLGSLSVAITGLKVSLAPIERVDGTFQSAGPRRVLATVALSNRPLTAGSGVAVTVSLTPRESAEWATLYFEVEGERRTTLQTMTTVHTSLGSARYPDGTTTGTTRGRTETSSGVVPAGSPSTSTGTVSSERTRMRRPVM